MSSGGWEQIRNGDPGKGRDILGERDAHPGHRRRPREHAGPGTRRALLRNSRAPGDRGLFPGLPEGPGHAAAGGWARITGTPGPDRGAIPVAQPRLGRRSRHRTAGNRGQGLGDWGPPWRAGSRSDREVPEPGGARCRQSRRKLTHCRYRNSVGVSARYWD